MRIRRQLKEVVPGAVLAIPLEVPMWTVAVVLATSPDRYEMLLHFPSTLFDHIPTPQEATASADPENLLLLKYVACQGFFQGEWAVVARLEPFDRDDWDLPPGFQTGGRPPYLLEVYDYDTLECRWVTVEHPDDAYFALPEGGLGGSVYAENVLRRLHGMPTTKGTAGP